MKDILLLFSLERRTFRLLLRIMSECIKESGKPCYCCKCDIAKLLEDFDYQIKYKKAPEEKAVSQIIKALVHNLKVIYRAKANTKKKDTLFEPTLVPLQREPTEAEQEEADEIYKKWLLKKRIQSS